MKPRKPTLKDCAYWGEDYVIAPMMGEHVGAENIYVIISAKENMIRVPWTLDDRDVPEGGAIDGLTIWTSFIGGMPPTDVVILDA